MVLNAGDHRSLIGEISSCIICKRLIYFLSDLISPYLMPQLDASVFPDSYSTACDTPFPWETADSTTTHTTKKAPSSTIRRVRDILKLVAVVFPPIVALATISFLVCIQATATMEDSRKMIDHLQTSEAIKELVHMLQRERGITCIYLGSKE